jgi:uncharacterized membrane protein
MAKASKNETAGESDFKPPLISDSGLVLSVYILYLFGFVTGLTAVIGVIIAFMQRDKADPVCQSHFQFQIRTFMIGLAYLFVAALTLYVGIGGVVLLWWIVWTLIRCIKGLLTLNAGEAIADPNSWLFG